MALLARWRSRDQTSEGQEGEDSLHDSVCCDRLLRIMESTDDGTTLQTNPVNKKHLGQHLYVFSSTLPLSLVQAPLIYANQEKIIRRAIIDSTRLPACMTSVVCISNVCSGTRDLGFKRITHHMRLATEWASDVWRGGMAQLHPQHASLPIGMHSWIWIPR